MIIYQKRLIIFITIIFRFLNIYCKFELQNQLNQVFIILIGNEIAFVYEQIFDNPYLKLDDVISKDENIQNKLIIVEPKKELSKYFFYCDKSPDYQFNIIQFKQNEKFQIQVPISFAIYQINVNIIAFTDVQSNKYDDEPFELFFNTKYINNIQYDPKYKILSNGESICQEKTYQERTYQVNYKLNVQLDNDLLLLKGVALNLHSGIHSISISYSKCDEGCKSCKDNPSNKNICIQCYQGFFLKEGKCLKFCQPDTQESKQQNCAQCPKFCFDCGQFSKIENDYSNCNSCLDGYEFQKVKDPSLQCQIDRDRCQIYKDGQCKQCKQNYNSLIQDSQLTCRSKCPQGYFVLKNECKPCSNSKCLVCENDVCQKCIQGYFLTKDNKCQECSKTLQGCNQQKNEKNCESCSDIFFLDNNNQYVTKCPNGFFGDQNSRKCIKCALENCKECSNSSKFSCTKCSDGELPLLNQCLGYCTSISTEKCIPCHKSCEKCNGTGEQNCLQCASGYYKYKQKCISKCPNFTYIDQYKQECIQCDDNLYCLKCKDSQKGSCIQCNQERVLKNGLCVQVELSCSESEYYDLVKKKCVSCSEKQNRCDGCPNKNNTCDKCKKDYKLINGACLSTSNSCPEGEIQVPPQNTCQKCNDNCKICEINKEENNKIQCIQCKQQYYLQENQCIFKQCQQGYYTIEENKTCIKCQDQNCKTCSKSSNQCTECKNQQLVQNDKCVISCDEHYYQENQICKLCFDSQKCLLCENGNEGSCKKCTKGYYLHLGKCIEQCPDYFYQNNTENICEKCNDNNCQQCNLGTTQCNKCKAGTYLIEGKCLTECPKLYYLLKSIEGQPFKSCVQCPQQCQKCQEDDENLTCLQCDKNFYLYNGICTLNCPVGYFEDKDKLKCEQCFGKQMSCKQCIGKDVGQCNSCRQNYYLKDGICLEQCPKFFFEDKDSFECRSCFDSNNCEKCNGKEENQCEKCIEGFHISMGKCMKDCQVNNCDECIISEQNKCQKCSKNFYNQNGLCQIECNQGFKPNNENNCVDCSSNQAGYCQKLRYTIIDNKNNSISIIFSQKIHDFTNYINDLQVKFDGERDKFPFSIKNKSETEILILINVNKNPDKNSIEIKIEYQNFEKLLLSTPYETEKVRLTYQTSQQNQAASKGITETTEAASSVAVASLLPLAITGQFQFIASAIDVSQLIYLMGFVNIKSPFNVSEFFQALRDFKIPFKNYFEGMKHYDQIYYDAPQKFEDKEIQGFFLQNAGDSISLTATILLVHFVLLIFIKITAKFKKVSFFIKKSVQNILSYSFYVDLLWGLYLDISLSFFLQLISLEKVDYLEEIVNYIFFIVIIFPILFPFVITEFIRRDLFPNLTAIFVQELNYKYFQIILYIRKLVMGFIIVVFQFQPEVQLSLLATWHIFMTILIYVKKPYIKQVDNIRNFLQGILFLTGTALLFGLQISNDEEEKKVLFGWIIILFFGLIIVIELGFFLKETGVLIHEKIKQMIQYLKDRKRCKITPIIQQINEKVKQENQVSDKDINNQENNQFNLTFHKNPIYLKETVIFEEVLYENNEKQSSQYIGKTTVNFDINPKKGVPYQSKDDILYTTGKLQTAASLDCNTLLNSQMEITNKQVNKKNEIKSLANINDTFSQNNDNGQDNELTTQQTSSNIQNTIESQLQYTTQQTLSEIPSPVSMTKKRSLKKRNMSYLLHGIKLNMINKQ